MLMPSLFTNSFMDDFFDAPSFGVYKYDAPAQNLMSTDVFENCLLYTSDAADE